MLKRLLSISLFSLFLLSCREVQVKEIKSFRIHVETDSTSLKDSIRILVRDYNRQLGFEALSVVEQKDESTSLIRFQKGLAEDGQKLGLGQWTAHQKRAVSGSFRQKEITTIEYGMDVVFDLENFASKVESMQEPDSDAYKHLFHLFSHEVGHGMHMYHSPEKGSVMSSSMPENSSDAVDFERYFANVRAFLGGPAPNLALHQDLYKNPRQSSL